MHILKRHTHTYNIYIYKLIDIPLPSINIKNIIYIYVTMCTVDK